MISPDRLSAALERQGDLERQRQQAQGQRTTQSHPDWARAHFVIRGRPLSFVGHEYLEGIYADDHPWQADMKAAQMGVSMCRISESIWVNERFGGKVVYYLATDEDAEDFSRDRVSPTIEQSEHINALLDERERGVDTVGLRHFGRGSMYVRGMVTRRKVKSIDADMVVFDELDEADQENKQFALDRIMHSELQWVRELSQPSVPDYGIHETFGRGDQQHWTLKCPGCGEWAVLELELEERDGGRFVPRHCLPVTGSPTWAKPGQEWYRGCLKCGAPLDMTQGEWVARYPSQDTIRSRQTSQLYRQQPVQRFADPADWMMHELLNARKTREKKRVTISILGLPYAGDRAPVTEAVLDNAEGEHAFLARATDCVMGIDQGDDLHIVVCQLTSGGLLQQVRIAHTDDWTLIRQLRRQYGVKGMVIDAMPNKKTAKDEVRAAREEGCKAWIQYFSAAALKEGDEGEGEARVPKINVDRTESLDETVDELKMCAIVLADLSKLGGEDLRLQEMFRSQLKQLVKDDVQTAKGVVKWEYKKQVPNHFGMALNSARIARDLIRGHQVDWDGLATTGVKTVAAKMLQAMASVADEPPPFRMHERDTQLDELRTFSPRSARSITEGFGYGS